MYSGDPGGQGVNVAVPVTVPEGWVGMAEVSLRVSFHCCFLPRDWKARAVRVGFGGSEGELEGGFEEETGIGEVEDEVEYGSGMRKEFTDFRVSREGLNVGFAVVNQVRRWRMKDLVIDVPVGVGVIFPVSVVWRQRTVRAMPRERSFPVGQHIKSFPGEAGREDINFGSLVSSFRRSRDPSLPSRQVRCRCFLCDVDSLKEASPQDIIASKSFALMS